MTSSKEIDHSDHHPVIVSSESVDRQVRGDPYSSETSEELLSKPTKIPKPNHSDMAAWLQEFKENLVDDRVPEHGDSHASSSHGLSLEPVFKRREDLGKHSVKTHFPKDRNCDICQRTNITKVPWRRRIGGAVPRAENLGDLITADHKVLSESCESPNNHRYAIVVQDFATQWIQSYPCKTKTSQETQRSSQKFLEPKKSLKSLTLTIPWHLARLVKIFLGIIARQHHTDQKQIGLLKRTVRRVKEGTSAVSLQSGLNESWWADSMECYTYLRNIQDLLSDGKTPYERRFGEPRTHHSGNFIGWVLPYFCERPVENPSIWKGSLTWIVPRIRSVRGGEFGRIK